MTEQRLKLRPLPGAGVWVAQDLAGGLYGSWLVLRWSRRTEKGRQMWLCRCVCEMEKEVESYNLTSGRSKACRKCSATEVVGGLVKHGQSGSKVYRAWQSMKTRCYNAKQEHTYKYHGALGIRVADEWLEDFEAFAAHIGEPPTPMHTVDRKDPWGHYEPGNVKWSTQNEQMLNTRRSRTKRGQLKPRP